MNLVKPQIARDESTCLGDTQSYRCNVVELLLDAGAVPNPQNRNKMTPLQLASKYGNIDAVRVLLEKRDFNCLGDALRYASEKGQVDVARLLIEKGADVNFKIYGKTALFFASELDMVKLLIENGADIDYVDCCGDTPLLNALTDEDRHTDIAKFLIEKGADVNFQNMDERTALFGAFAFGDLDIVKFLIDNGADVNHQDINGDTPLIEALTTGLTEEAKLLIEKGADVNIKSNVVLELVQVEFLTIYIFAHL
eukprot:GHVR01042881.1.p1 GENE.GHVR01042881.1~~GHVR01042881.1.p1  ORF type:complete len:253 (+),score=23.39 GHVR01042881.1:132-890(+)